MEICKVTSDEFIIEYCTKYIDISNKILWLTNQITKWDEKFGAI